MSEMMSSDVEVLQSLVRDLRKQVDALKFERATHFRLERDEVNEPDAFTSPTAALQGWIDALGGAVDGHLLCKVVEAVVCLGFRKWPESSRMESSGRRTCHGPKLADMLAAEAA